MAGTGGAGRAGFTIVELLVVLVVIGVLAILLAPSMREATTGAKASALAERVHAVQVAYAGANDPVADSLQSAPGTVPAAFARALGSGHFAGEAGVRLSIVGSGKDVWLRLEAGSDEARRTLASLQRLAKVPNLHTASVTLVPLSPGAIDLVEAMRRTPQGASGDMSGSPDGQQAAAEAAGDASAGTAGIGAGSAGGSGGERDSSISPPELSTKESHDGSNPVCAPTLPSAQYRACLAATSSGWLRK